MSSSTGARASSGGDLRNYSDAAAKFDVALADYKQVVDRCKLRTP